MIWEKKWGAPNANYVGIVGKEYVGYEYFIVPVLLDGVPVAPDKIDPTLHEYAGITRPSEPPPLTVLHNSAPNFYATNTSQKWRLLWNDGEFDRLTYRSLK